MPRSIDLVREQESLRHHPRRRRRHADGPHQPHHQRRGRRAPCYAKVETFNPGQLDQGPDGDPDDRGRRARGHAQAGRHDHRGHVRQHRHGPRDRRGRQGLQVHLHDHRQAVEGEGRRAEGVRRRSDRLPDQRRARGSAVVLLGVVAARARSARTRGRRTSTTTCRTRRRTTSRPGPRSGSRPTAASRTWSSASAPAARSPAPAATSKEQNPKIKVWGIDTYGSVFKKYKETGIFDKHEIYPYITEGIGEDFLPKNVDFDVIDHFEKVTDKDAAIDDAAHRARGRASSPATPPDRRWPACCSCAITSPTTT